MILKHFDKISFSGSDYNEDIASVLSSAAWVIDGATGLSKKKYSFNDSDAKWFVERWNEYLKEALLDNQKSLSCIISNGIDHVCKEYRDIIKDNLVDEIDMPSASISIVRWNESYAEYFILGDCQVWLKKGNNIDIISDNKLGILDNVAIKAMDLYIKEGYSLNQARDAIQDILIKNRLKKNTREGYWTLSFDRNAIYHAINDKISLEGNHNNIELLLCSDGFHCIVEKYKLMTSSEIFDYIFSNGLSEIYNMIRQVENSDSEGKKFPRFKKSDDSTAVYLKFT